nr:hypothetical protein [uncultured Halomonas sp.]
MTSHTDTRQSSAESRTSPLKVRLAKAERSQKLRAFGLTVPLLAFVLVTFVYPIVLMAYRSIDDPVAVRAIPETLQALQDWTPPQPPGEAVCEIFLQDLPRDQAMAAAQRFCSQPEGTRALVANWTAERFGRLPRLYVEATEDRSVVLAAQRKMQALVPGAQVVSLPCGHVPQVVQTAAVAEALLAFAS